MPSKMHPPRPLVEESLDSAYIDPLVLKNRLKINAVIFLFFPKKKKSSPLPSFHRGSAHSKANDWANRASDVRSDPTYGRGYPTRVAHSNRRTDRSSNASTTFFPENRRNWDDNNSQIEVKMQQPRSTFIVRVRARSRKFHTFPDGERAARARVYVRYT